MYYKNCLRDSIQPTHSLQVALVVVTFGHTPSTPQVYLESPPPNLINLSYINIKFDQEHLQHPFVFQQQSHLWTPLLALIYFDIIICFRILAYQVLISMLLWCNKSYKYLVLNSFIKTPK